MSENTSALPDTNSAPLAHLSSVGRRPRPPAPQPLPEPVTPPEDSAPSAPVLDLTERTPAPDADVAVPAEAVKRRRRPATSPAVAVAGVADDLEHLRGIKARFSGESAPNKNLQLPVSLADTLARRADELGAPERYLVAAALTEFFERRQVNIESGYTGHRRKL